MKPLIFSFLFFEFAHHLVLACVVHFWTINGIIISSGSASFSLARVFIAWILRRIIRGAGLFGRGCVCLLFIFLRWCRGEFFEHDRKSDFAWTSSLTTWSGAIAFSPPVSPSAARALTLPVLGGRPLLRGVSPTFFSTILIFLPEPGGLPLLRGVPSGFRWMTFSLVPEPGGRPLLRGDPSACWIFFTLLGEPGGRPLLFWVPSEAWRS